jgi:AcrR family transcriptional regulator
MQRRDPDKSREILDAATALFAANPFHEVKLDAVAATAGVGKGTLYLYWRSKEELYLAVIRRGFANVLDRIRRELAPVAGRPWQEIETIVSALVDFAFTFPGLYRIMRSGAITPEDAELQAVRAELTRVMEGVICAGVRAGVLADPSPALTTQYILSFARGALLYPPPDLEARVLKDHMLHILRRGLCVEVAR